MGKLLKKLLSGKHYIALCLSLVILGLTLFNTNTNANTAVVGDNQLSRVTAKQAKDLKIDEWVQNSENRLSTKGILEKYSNSLKFNNEKTHIMKVANKQQTLYFVYIPIKDGAEKDSHYIMLFNDKGTFIEDYLLLGLKDKDNVRSLVYKNNQIVLDAIADTNGNLISGYTVNANGMKQEINASSVQPQGFWSCVNNCLASQGIASWAIAALGVLCAVACIGTAGAACYGCLLAADIGAGATVGYCTGTCQKDPSSY